MQKLSNPRSTRSPYLAAALLVATAACETVPPVSKGPALFPAGDDVSYYVIEGSDTRHFDVEGKAITPPRKNSDAEPGASVSVSITTEDHPRGVVAYPRNLALFDFEEDEVTWRDPAVTGIRAAAAVGDHVALVAGDRVRTYSLPRLESILDEDTGPWLKGTGATTPRFALPMGAAGRNVALVSSESMLAIGRETALIHHVSVASPGAHRVVSSEKIPQFDLHTVTHEERVLFLGGSVTEERGDKTAKFLVVWRWDTTENRRTEYLRAPWPEYYPLNASDSVYARDARQVTVRGGTIAVVHEDGVFCAYEAGNERRWANSEKITSATVVGPGLVVVATEDGERVVFTNSAREGDG